MARRPSGSERREARVSSESVLGSSGGVGCCELMVTGTAFTMGTAYTLRTWSLYSTVGVTGRVNTAGKCATAANLSSSAETGSL